MTSTNWSRTASESTDWTRTGVNSTNWGQAPIYSDSALLLQDDASLLLLQDGVNNLGLQA